ncbi:hypothetical protein Syncc8109_1653 [Synechococcus sp. WH 8109]|nr:hypothetical protein Syncc8109_1653 [Synechococcus sp. WH 8109]
MNGFGMPWASPGQPDQQQREALDALINATAMGSSHGP